MIASKHSKHDGGRHEQGVDAFQARAQHAEGQQQHCFDQQRQRIFAGQAAAAPEVDSKRGAGGAQQEGQHGAAGIQRQVPGAKRQAVGRRGDCSRQVRGVAPHGEKAAGIDGAGHEGERHTEVAVGARAARIA
jgi:hypothetical protein